MIGVYRTNSYESVITEVEDRVIMRNAFSQNFSILKWNIISICTTCSDYYGACISFPVSPEWYYRSVSQLGTGRTINTTYHFLLFFIPFSLRLGKQKYFSTASIFLFSVLNITYYISYNRYHLGTIATGSFLIATCGFIRTILEHTQRLLKQSDGLVTQCLTWGMRCCFWCLQKFLIFVSHNAYIMCAINGANFFSSAEEALGLLARNIIRVVVLDKVGCFFLRRKNQYLRTFRRWCFSWFYRSLISWCWLESYRWRCCGASFHTSLSAKSRSTCIIR